MKVDKKEYEGGDDAAGEEKKGPPSKEERYAERSGNFKVTEYGLTEEAGMVRGERSCTDLLCVVLFLVFVSCMFGLAFFGIANGNPAKLMAPYDFSSQICGHDPSVKDYPKLYFTKLAPGWDDAIDSDGALRRFFYEKAVCVKECPS